MPFDIVISLLKNLTSTINDGDKINAQKWSLQHYLYILGILLSTYYVPVSAWHCPAVDKTSVYPGPLSPLHYLGR